MPSPDSTACENSTRSQNPQSSFGSSLKAVLLLGVHNCRPISVSSKTYFRCYFLVLSVTQHVYVFVLRHPSTVAIKCADWLSGGLARG